MICGVKKMQGWPKRHCLALIGLFVFAAQKGFAKLPAYMFKKGKEKRKHQFPVFVALESCFAVFPFLRQGDQAPSVQFKGHGPRHICFRAGPRV